jgi:glycosyltransferase involved in cell wall biosynthesis
MSIDRTPTHPPAIRAFEGQGARPLFSVMIPAYNCAGYLEVALKSVLDQDPGVALMQIEVIDDHSTDADVGAIVERLGKGRVGYFRQEKNVGSLRNFETCLNRSKGQWIHLLHGDDFVAPGFYREIRALFEAYPDAGAAFTGFYYIGPEGAVLYPNRILTKKSGYVDNWREVIAQSQCIQPPAMVVKRSVYEDLGSFFGVHYGEDWEMWVRISYAYPVVHSPMRLANYRIHPNNITSQYFKTGRNIVDIIQVVDTIQGYLPPARRKRLKRLALKNFSIYFARCCDMVYHGHGEPFQAARQSIQALRMNVNRLTLYYAVKTFFKIMIRYKWTARRAGASGRQPHSESTV